MNRVDKFGYLQRSFQLQKKKKEISYGLQVYIEFFIVRIACQKHSKIIKVRFLIEGIIADKSVLLIIELPILITLH